MKKQTIRLKLNKQTIIYVLGREGASPDEVNNDTFPPTRTFTVPSVGTCTCRCV